MSTTFGRLEGNRPYYILGAMLVLVSGYYALGINHMLEQALAGGAPLPPAGSPPQPIGEFGTPPARPPFAGDDDYIPGERPPVTDPKPN